MKTFTLALVEKVRALSRQSLHTKDQLDFLKQEKCEALEYAMQYREPYDTDRDIITRAEKYLHDIKKH